MKNEKLSLSILSGALTRSISRVGKYSGLLFFVIIAFVYTFLIYRIHTLSSVEPTQSVVTAKARTPHIDKNLVLQLQQLKDNSVNVQTLFDQARDNPFHE